MREFKEYHLSYDFVVIGGGMAGLCAALAAARHGAKTALVQDRPVLGGNASSEIRMHICGASDEMNKLELSEGGIIHELLLENKSLNDSYNYSIWDAVLFQKAKDEKNLTLFLNTTMHAVICHEKAITSVQCYQMTTEKTFFLSAKCFADCTGNGTLAAFAGASFRTGSEAKREFNERHAPEQANNDRMGNTLLFKAADMGHPTPFVPPVEVMHFTEEQLKYRKHTSKPTAEMLKKASEHEMKLLFDGIAADFGYWWIELPGTGEDIINEYEDIRDELVKAIYGIWNHIKNDSDHGAQNYQLVWVGMLPGTRESRRIEGDYILTENDVLENRRFEDSVAYGGWHIDNHVAGGLYAYDKLPSFVYAVDGSYNIPYRSYLVKDFKNLFVCGRALSATKLAMATTRVMATCAIGGQAVGIAAALSAKNNLEIRDVPIAQLQQLLMRDDCYLPGIPKDDPEDMMQSAVLAANAEKPGYKIGNLTNGITRAIDGQTNAWRADMTAEEPPTLTAAFKAASTISTVQLVFDSNFDIPKMISLNSRKQQPQKTGVPIELVRDFTVELLKDNEVVAIQTVTENHQRLVRVSFPQVSCDALRVKVLATNGCDEARVFEVRAYADSL